MSINRRLRFSAIECVERIRSSSSESAFGYKIQAIAAHVLLRLGYRITAVEHQGHPDIIAIKDGREFRFEVEAQATGPRPRRLTDADFTALTGTPIVVGYYALAISFPEPTWVLVSASKLVDRTRPCPNELLKALSDEQYSAEWTREYVSLLQGACRRIMLASFDDLRQMALAGCGL